MDYRNIKEVETLNKYIWGNYKFKYRIPGKSNLFTSIDGLVIEAVTRQTIPAIYRSTIKVPGVDGMRMTGAASLGSSLIEMRVSKFTNSRMEALEYRNTLFNLFYTGSRGDKIEVSFPDTGELEYVWLNNIELQKITKSGIATYTVSFENPDGLSHNRLATTLESEKPCKLDTIKPIEPIISFNKIVDINKDIRLSVKTRDGYIAAIIIPPLNTITYSGDSKIEAARFKHMDIDTHEQSIIYTDVGYNKYDVTADILKNPLHLLDFKALKQTDELLVKTENISGTLDVEFTEYRL